MLDTLMPDAVEEAILCEYNRLCVRDVVRGK